METFDHINQWTPGTSVLPSIPNEEQIGSVQKQFSGTITKQKLQADQSTSTFAEFGLDKQKKSLQTKFLSGDVGENLNSTVLPPELLNDILSLREDYPEEDCINLGRKGDLIHVQRKQNKCSHQSETHQKTFSEAIAKFKTFDSAVDNVFEGVVLCDDSFSVRKKKSCDGSDQIPLEEGSSDVSVLKLSRKSSVVKGCAFNDKGNASFPEGSASFPEGSAFFPEGNASFPEGNASPGKVSVGELQGPAKPAVNEILAQHFASEGKVFCPVDLQGTNSSTDISNTNISLSELIQAAQYHNINDILLFSNRDPPNTNKPHTQSNSSGIGETFGQRKLAEPDGLGNLAKQGHRPTNPPQKLPSDIPNLSNVKMPPTNPLGESVSQSPIMLSQDGASQSYSGGSVSVLANWSMPVSGKVLPGAIQNICTQSSLDISAQSEPPDLTRYTCSDELKQALQVKFLPFKHHDQARPNNQVNGGAACGQRYHPYTKPETSSTAEFQNTLPNLPEFMQNIFK